MSDKYNWLEDLPTNPPKPGSTETRNTLQDAVPNVGYRGVDYQPADGDYILTPLNMLGTRAEVVLVGGTFTATFEGVQVALEYLSRLFQAGAPRTRVWQRLPNGLLSPMVIN